MSDVKVKFILSEGIETQVNGFQQRQVIINPVLVFSTPYIPTSLSLAVSIVISGLTESDHKIGFNIRSKKEAKSIFESDIASVEIKDSLDNFVMTADLKNIGFEFEGDYEVVLTLDGQEYSDVFSLIKRQK